MKRIVQIAVLLATASCRTTPAPPSEPLVDTRAPDVPPALAKANTAFRQHLRLTQFTAVPPEAQAHERVLRALIRWKTNRGSDATRAFEAALTRNADPDVEEFSLIRLAVYQLNLGCEVAGLHPPAEFDASRQAIFGDILSVSAFRTIEPARGYLEAAARLGGRRLELVSRLRDALPRNESQVGRTCTDLAEAWRSPDPASLDEVASLGCGDGEGALCWVWAKWGTGGDEALTRACDGDVAEACTDVADRRVVFMHTQSNPSAAVDAEKLYAKACALGSTDGCRKEVAVIVPSREEEYRSSCLGSEDAVACIKLARTLSLATPDRSLWWTCTAPLPRPETDKVLSLCSQGDAFACAARAGTLRTDVRYVVKLSEAPAEDSSAAVVKCGEGDAQACASAARAFARDGDWGCAASVMSEGCRQGATHLCGFAETN